jgi:carboxyl-terminal processing protease
MPMRSLLAAAVALLALPTLAQQAPPEPEAERRAASGAGDTGTKVPLDEIRRYVEVYNAIKQAYVEPVDDAELMSSAVRGLLFDLDPHSVYFEKNEAKDFEEGARGAYEGIGVELQRQPDGTLRVVAPIDGTPAARAGIKSGDVIVAIDGKPFKVDEGDSSAPLRGEAGTAVVLTILRKGRDRPLEISVVRETIRIASVRGRILEPGFGYLRISAFQADTAADFQRELAALQSTADGRLRGLVIDLRSNPGGLLTSAVQIADDLLERGQIVSTRGRIAITDAQFSATPGDRLDGAPVVVLVDAGSASASEVLAGALADNGRARIVGSRTFGKGSVQTLLPLDNGDSVKLTTARYYTPNGRSIQASGIAPDVVLQPDGDTVRRDRRATEASLPGHLGADKDGGAGVQPGDVLEGEAPVQAALTELRRMATATASSPPREGARP